MEGSEASMRKGVLKNGRDAFFWKGPMVPASPNNFSPTRVLGWAGFVVLLGLLFFLRRWDQFLYPGVYAEDGMIVLPDALTMGWGALFDPVQGYLAVTTRAFGSLALLPGGLAGYPLWGSVLAAFFGIFVLVYLAATPSLLPLPRWFALAAALVPTGSEVFCLPFMAFWWAGLLLMVLVLRTDHESSGLLATDLLLAGICGLSGVIAPLAAFVLFVRLFVFRDSFRGGLWLLATLVATGLVQLVVFLVNGKGTAGDVSIGEILSGYASEPFQSASRLIRKFFGEFLFYGVPDGVWPQTLLALAGLFLIGILIVSGWRTGKPLFVYLWLFLLGTLALAVIRVDLTLMDSIKAAPRYFFYPWVLLSWMLIAVLIFSQGKTPRYLCAICLILGSTGLVRAFLVPPADDLGWEASVERLHEEGFQRLPVHYDGQADRKWEMPLFYQDGEYHR